MDNLDVTTHKIMTGVLYCTSAIGLIILVVVIDGPIKWIQIVIYSMVIAMALYSHHKYYSHKTVDPRAKKFLVIEVLLVFVVISFGMHNYEHIFILLVVGDCVMAFSYRFSLIFTILTYAFYYPYVAYFYPLLTGMPYGTDYIDDVMIVSFVLMALYLAKRQTGERVKYNQLLVERNDAYDELELFAEKIEESAVLEERSRIALLLHNSLGHALVATNLSLQAEKAEKMKEGEITHEAFREVEQGLQKSMALLRQMVEGEEDFLLVTPFAKIMTLFIEDISNNTGIQVQYTAKGIDQIPDSFKRIAFNTVMESMTNAMKHADPKEINVIIECHEQELEIVVADDGRGFSDIIYGYGTSRLKKMIEGFHGHYELISENGCTVKASIPLKG